MKQDERLEGILISIALAVIVNIVAEWIAEHIKDWFNREVLVPEITYQMIEPGYVFSFPEDDES